MSSTLSTSPGARASSECVRTSSPSVRWNTSSAMPSCTLPVSDESVASTTRGITAASVQRRASLLWRSRPSSSTAGARVVYQASKRGRGQSVANTPRAAEANSSPASLRRWPSGSFPFQLPVTSSVCGSTSTGKTTTERRA
jgi:hypothetical protein